MKLKVQILIVNAAVLAGLIYKYLRGSPLGAVVLTGILLLTMVNVIFLFRVRRPKSLQ